MLAVLKGWYKESWCWYEQSGLNWHIYDELHVRRIYDMCIYPCKVLVNIEQFKVTEHPQTSQYKILLCSCTFILFKSVILFHIINLHLDNLFLSH